MRALLRPDDQRHARAGNGRERRRDRRSCSRPPGTSSPKRQILRDEPGGRPRGGARPGRRASMRSSRPAAPASRRATAPTKRSRAARKAARRLRRAVPRAQLRGDRRAPRCCAARAPASARHRDLLAAGIRERRPPRDDEADPAGDRARRPGAAAVTRSATPATDAADPRDHSARRGAGARSSTAATPIARTERVPLATATDASIAAAPPVRDVDVPPFDRAAMDGYAVRRRGHVRRRPLRPEALRAHREGLHRPGRRRAASARGECIEIATGAPMPDGRGRGRDGRGNRDGGGRTDVRDLHAGLSAAARRPPRRRHRRRPDGARAPATSSTRAASARSPRSASLEVEVFAKPRDRHPLDRQRDRRARRSRSARARSTTSTASRSSPIIAAHGGVAGAAADGRRTRSRRSSAAIDAALAEDVLVFSGGSSVGERDLILDVAAADAAR